MIEAIEHYIAKLVFSDVACQNKTEMSMSHFYTRLLFVHLIWINSISSLLC